MLSWAEAEGAAVDPLRRRDQRRRRGRGRGSASGPSSPSTCAGSTGCSRSTPTRWRRGSRRARPGPALEEQLREHGLTLRHFPQSFEYSTLGGWIATRAGGHFATLYTHIDDLVESVRAITPRGTWESRRLPGSGAGPSPDRVLIGSEGILGVIAEAWVRVRPRPEFKASCGVEFDDFLAAARRRARDLAVGPAPGQLPPARRARGRDDRGRARREEPARARLRVGPPPGRAADGAGARDRPRSTAARPRRGAASERRPEAAGAGGGGRAPGAAPSCWRPTCATPSSPAASSPTPSRRRSPGTASRTSTRP